MKDIPHKIVGRRTSSSSFPAYTLKAAYPLVLVLCCMPYELFRLYSKCSVAVDCVIAVPTGTARRGSCKFPYWTSDAMQIRPIVQLMTMHKNKPCIFL